MDIYPDASMVVPTSFLIALIAFSHALYNFKSSLGFWAGGLLLLPNHQTLHPELWISELWWLVEFRLYFHQV